MADEQPQAEEQQKKGGSKIIVIAVVAVLMIVEAAAVYFVVQMASPASAAADVALEGEDPNDPDRLIEQELVVGRFFNASTGRPFSYQVDIFIKVRQKHLERVQAELERRQAEIKEGVAQIIAGSQQRHLMFEPGRETLKRQLTAFTTDIFGTVEGDPRVVEVLVPKLDGSPLDY